MGNKKSTVGLLINAEERCVLDFNGTDSVAFMDIIMMILRNQASHIQNCSTCQTNYNLTQNQVEEITKFTENLLEMRGHNASINIVH